jgi:tRNA-2-methylthio-N6-dimethylallyladenosine synthase
MLKFYIKTYGCQMNERDSESLACLLEAKGYTESLDENDADILIFNTCSVRDQAERKVIGKVGLMKRLKQQRPELIIGIIGCMAQRMGEQLLEKLPHLDFVAGTDQLQNIPNILAELLAKRGTRISATENGPGVFSELDGHRAGHLISEISVMRGCDQFCTYCIVPYCRGREKSRPIEAIVDEAERLAAGGTREILLLGQNITAYGVAEARRAGTYTPEFSAFADLLVALNDVKGIERIRFTSPHVKFMNDKFVEAVTGLPKVCKCFHIPVQSGSDRILKKMNRNYTAAEYLNRIDAIRAKAPEALFSTDIIVGFCSETREEFNMTHDLMKRVGYDMAYIFRYSQREGTRAAASMPDDVPEEEKHERNQILLEELNTSVAKHNASMVGCTVPVLIEGPSPRNPNRWCGRSDLNKMVLFTPSEALKVGDIHNFVIRRATGNALYGE